MPDNTLEGSLAHVPGLTEYLAMDKYLKDRAVREQQQGQQQQFIQEQQNLPPDATAEQRANLGMRFLNTPHEAVQYGLTYQAKREALAATLMHHNELISVARERNQQVADAQAARLTDKQTQDVVRNEAKKRDQDLHERQISNEKLLKELGLDIQQQKVDLQRGKNDEPLLNFLDKIDATKRMIQSNPEAVGGRGILGRGAEFIGGLVNPGQETPASNLQTQILDLQTSYRGLPGHAASRLKIDAANIDKLIKGLGTFSTADQAVGSLDTLRDTVSKQLRNPSANTPAVEAPSEAPAGTAQIPPAPRDPNNRVDGVPYTTPKGVLKWDKKKNKWLAP